MIKTLSPYYLYTPFLSPLTGATAISYTIVLYVWNGLKASPPVTASYQITKKNQTAATGSDKVNIAKLINDFIDFQYLSFTNTTMQDGNNQIWCRKAIIYNTIDGADAGVEQIITTDLVLKGYGYGMDGENSQPPANGVLINGTEFKIYTDGSFVIPVLADEVLSHPITVIGYPSLSQINFATPITDDSARLVQNIFISPDDFDDANDTSIEVTYNGVTIFLYVTNECRYTPIEITFQNKEGSIQSITFFKAMTDSMDVKEEIFESDRGQPIDGIHQYVKFNVQALSKFNINSGFVSETNNINFKELLLSERTWANIGGVTTPINVSSKSIEYKTRQKDRLINYNIEFSYAFNEINNA